MSKVTQRNFTTYFIGYMLSIVLTLAAFFIVINETFHGWALVFTLTALALTQLWIQLQFFIHLGNESKPRWNLVVFLFMVLVVLIVVGGSLWIMHNLNYHMMSPHDMDTQLIEEEGVNRH